MAVATVESVRAVVQAVMAEAAVVQVSEAAAVVQAALLAADGEAVGSVWAL